jgi:hypothetical protein
MEIAPLAARSHSARVRFGLAVALLMCLAFAVAGVARPAQVRLRSCGTLAVGIGWHLRATPDVGCVFARKVIKTYFARGGERRVRTVALRFVCTHRYPSDGEHIRCVQGTKVVAARSFGY